MPTEFSFTISIIYLVASRYSFCCKIDDLAEGVWSDVKIAYCLPSNQSHYSNQSIFTSGAGVK